MPVIKMKSNYYSGPCLIWPLDNWASHLIGPNSSTHVEAELIRPLLNGPLNWTPLTLAKFFCVFEAELSGPTVLTGWVHFITKGFRCVPARDCWHKSLGPLMDEVRQQMGDRPVYLTFDIDALDPAFAPGTGKMWKMFFTVSCLGYYYY